MHSHLNSPHHGRSKIKKQMVEHEGSNWSQSVPLVLTKKTSTHIVCF